MSEAATKLAMILHCGAEIESPDPLLQRRVDEKAAKIDAAVAPLVAVVERITADSQRGTSGRLIISFTNEDELKKALEPWRK